MSTWERLGIFPSSLSPRALTSRVISDGQSRSEALGVVLTARARGYNQTREREEGLNQHGLH
jgi:hypothetical protein